MPTPTHYQEQTTKEVPMRIDSPVFKSGDPIPKKYTCLGVNVSPQLNLHDVPADVRSFALIMEDPDAPNGTFDHWIAWNFSKSTRQIPEGIHAPREGRNSYGEGRYRGPCPPFGENHRYYFKVYALDRELTLPSGSSKEQLHQAMEGHVLEEAELVGTFAK
jgi:Raf kinase inhibitor-like YbhB/YbcL family protein